MTLAPLSLSTNFNVKFSLAQAFTPGKNRRCTKPHLMGLLKLTPYSFPVVNASATKKLVRQSLDNSLLIIRIEFL